MRKWLIIIILAAFFATLSGTSWSIQNPAVRNPAGTSTTPASSAVSGLIRSPNPIDTSGNLIITGNVRRGKSFQGSVPYNASTSFGATLGSTSLNSFLRDSAGSEDADYYSGKYTPQPYYSPSGTVTTTTPGRPGVFNPAVTKTDGRAAGTSNMKTTAQAASGINLSLPNQTGPYLAQDTKASVYDLRPVRISPTELEKLISDGVAVAGRAKRLVDEEDLAQIERLQHDMEQLRLKAADLRQSLVVRDDSLRPFNKIKQEEDKKALQPIKPQEPKEKTEEAPASDSTKLLQGIDQIGLQEQLRQQLENLQKALLQRSAAQQVEKTEDKQEKVYSETTPQPMAKESERKRSPKFSSEVISEMDNVKPLSELPEAKKDVLSPTDTDSSAKTKRILSEYKTFNSFLEDKFNQHMKAAEVHLKQGRYYQAADTYTLASIYKSDEPLSCAGKSHALFAAGEYMRSALFLSRALKISPEQAKTKVDFLAIFGDQDKLEKRVADVGEWLQRSGAAELQFLLGYVYYQTGRLQDAQKAINSAYEKNPNSPAVVAVKQAIEDALISEPQKKQGQKP